MALSMSRRCLRLSLRAGENLPANLSWRIQQGYVWLARWSTVRDPLTLGIWGPGEVVIPDLIGLSRLELRTISAVVADEEEASSAMEREFLDNQLRHSAILLLISRARPAESRLLQLLDWFSTRFGTMTSQGRLLRLGEKPLTHQQLADIAGMKRVTVTKTLASLRQSGVITELEGGSILLRVTASELWECS
jgi:hypothetical protein